VERGTVINERYLLVDPVGEGSLAVLWQAVDRTTQSPVALKVMKREFAAVGGHYLELFQEEARLGAQLDHANLVHVLDFVAEPVAGSTLYCQVMEWIDGIDLRSLVTIEHRAQRPLAPGLVSTIGVAVLLGLAAAHERKLAGGILSPVIHRDVAPQNILLGVDGAVKLGDFGMARARDRIAERTAPGVVKGTLAYVAPECLKGDPPSPRSDLYSLGVTLWEAIAGERMFHVTSQIALIDKIRAGAIEPIASRRADVPPALAAVIHRALSTDPHQRYANAHEMAAALAEVAAAAGVLAADQEVGSAVTRAIETRDATAG
jgi:serine/threonine-protein kinase